MKDRKFPELKIGVISTILVDKHKGIFVAQFKDSDVARTAVEVLNACKESLEETVKEKLLAATQGQRKEFFECLSFDFCFECGSNKGPRCNCMKDD